MNSLFMRSAACQAQAPAGGRLSRPGRRRDRPKTGQFRTATPDFR